LKHSVGEDETLDAEAVDLDAVVKGDTDEVVVGDLTGAEALQRYLVEDSFLVDVAAAGLRLGPVADPIEHCCVQTLDVCHFQFAET
jgi:hypothetical protein